MAKLLNFLKKEYHLRNKFYGSTCTLTYWKEKNGHIISGNFLCCSLLCSVDFLAEYQLEHIIEHNKEKEYMISMVEDLAQDTIEVNRANSQGS